jgi:cysteine-rich repeat protein
MHHALLSLLLLGALLSTDANAQSSQPTSIPTSSLSLPVCGDHITEGKEHCDDGNTINGDGCSSKCRIEPCGNGVIQSGELCDDGNPQSGDGCSSLCQIEEGKSPTMAHRLALRSTLIGIPTAPILIGIPLLVVGPSAGHIYAKENKKAIIASTVRLTAGVASIAAFFAVFDGAGSVEGIEQLYVALVPIGVGVFLGSTIHSIADAPRAAKRANAKAAGVSLKKPISQP